MIETDICVIGAGPAGLFAVFEAGLLKMRCHVIDALPQPGGQLSELYPQKPIYDIPGYPVIKAQDLVDRLLEQIRPFRPTFAFGERAELINTNQHDALTVLCSHSSVRCKVVVIAGGLGSFEPRKPNIPGLKAMEGKGVSYWVKDPQALKDRDVAIAGGGDSALDWALELSGLCRTLTLIHRGSTFRGAAATAEKIQNMADAGKINLLLQAHVTQIFGENRLTGIRTEHQDGTIRDLKTDYFIPLFGMTPSLGPITGWDLAMNGSCIAVNPVDFSTSRKCIYAIGDVNDYPGKLKLILCGFHEAALMAQSAFQYVHPEQKLNFKYTTVYGLPAL